MAFFAPIPITVILALAACLCVLVNCSTGPNVESKVQHSEKNGAEGQRSKVHRSRKEARLRDEADLAKRSLRNCHVIERKQDKSQALSRHTRDVKSYFKKKSSFGNAVRFSTKSAVLRLRKDDVTLLPRQTFSVTAWIKPAGGQEDGVPIIGYFDKCSAGDSDRGWAVGLRTWHENGKSGARIYFSVRTDRALKRTVIDSHNRYEADEWIHVAAVYNSKKMRLYINGAKVGTSHDQRGDLHSAAHAICREIEIGGSLAEKKQFRGSIDSLQIWNKAIRHQDIASYMYTEKFADKSLTVSETFAKLDKWQKIGRALPVLARSDIPFFRHDVQITTPPCGRSICDDPNVVMGYVNNWKMRQRKNLHYRIINVANDNGRNPTVTQQQIERQHATLVKAFKPYNITWEKSEIVVRNTTLRKKTILYGCNPSDVGNGMCNPECKHSQTGNDGGDCDVEHSFCDDVLIDNNFCNVECNKAYHDWDGGDCCKPEVTSVEKTCFDPTSELRSYMTTDEYKTILNISSAHHLNIFFASWTTEDLVGLATLPWEKQVYSVLGGTVVQPTHFGVKGQTDNLVHEIGHNLGLWHVHHGVSETDCNDRCFERTPSLTLGDLCNDTNPTPENYHCREPDVEQDTCAGPYTDTPFSNYMSYADDQCTNHFTSQQNARMHCYIDLRYQPWQTKPQPPAVSVAPQVVSATSKTVRLAWVPPVGDSYSESDSVCNLCADDDILIQYASRAKCPAEYIGHWSPQQATGPPDAETCEPSARAWLPNVFTCDEECYLDLYFDIHVVPTSIYIWVTWNDVSSLADVVLYGTDGKTLSLGKVPIFCDVPFTSDLATDLVIEKVRIYTSSPYVGIDAVQLTSAKGQRDCSECVPIKYKVSRQPAFPTGETRTVNLPSLEDSDVEQGETYTYAIQAANVHGVPSEKSTPLVYTHGSRFCGDGKLNSNEQCDDGNAVDGDGCTLKCQVEEFYICKGEPSLCYMYFGDGYCENQDRLVSSPDCTQETPDGFHDQWGHSALPNPTFQAPECPETSILGPPRVPVVCGGVFDSLTSWSPCGHSYTDEDFWIKVMFQTPEVATSILIYLASDGSAETDEGESPSINVQLIDTSGDTHPLEEPSVSCKRNPVQTNVKHDLSQPFFKTQGVKISFTSYSIAISAVVLRSSNHLSPVTLQSCGEHQLFNPGIRQCVNYECNVPKCGAEPTLDNGRVKCSGTSEGATCSVLCEDGYKLKNSADVTCVNGIWTNFDVTKCTPVECTKPIVDHASVTCPEGRQFGKQCTFECKTSSVMQGTNNILTCASDRMWSLPQAFCKVMCPPLTDLSEGTDSVTGSCSRSHVDVGFRCKIKCSKGYHVEGFRTKRRLLRLACSDKGLWEGPSCVRIQCSEPKPMFTGLYTCSDHFNEGSICKLRCPESDKVNSVTCLSSGEWNKNFKPCTNAKKQCPDITTSNGVAFDCESKEIGARCSVACGTPSHTVIQEDVTGNDPSTVSEVMCTYASRWFPPPDTLACVQECGLPFIQDGWCDPSNNRAICNWDGGDCCPSTVEDGSVKPFNCDSGDCTCKDPMAAENLRQNGGTMQADQPMRKQNTMQVEKYRGRISEFYQVDRRPWWYFSSTVKP